MRYFLLSFLLLPTLTHAVSYTPLVGIPGIDTNDFDSFIDTLYTFSISIAALLAVIKITIAGVKYMLTDVVTSKGDAKKDIQGALLGLLVVVGAVLILNVINPQLTNIGFNPPPVEQVEWVEGTPLGDIVFEQGDAFLPADNEEACTEKDDIKCSGGNAYCYEGEWHADRGACLVKKENLVKPGVPGNPNGDSYDMWRRYYGGEIIDFQNNPEAKDNVPNGAFIVSDHYDETGALDFCKSGGVSSPRIKGPVTLKFKTTNHDHYYVNVGVLDYPGPNSGGDIWLSTEPLKRGTEVCREPRGYQRTPLQDGSLRFGTNGITGRAGCDLAPDSVYFLNYTPDTNYPIANYDCKEFPYCGFRIQPSSRCE